MSTEHEFVTCNVFVAVRARPFNSREKDVKSRSCLKFYNGDSVQIAPPSSRPSAQGSAKMVSSIPGEARSFTFDKAYSMNTSQEQLFEDLGRPVVAASMEGYNACIFAYGQTGSGKSFSMIGPSDAAHILAPAPPEPTEGDDGDGDDAPAGSTPPPTTRAAVAADVTAMRGLIPRILEAVFEECRQRTAKNERDVEATKDLPFSERTPKLAISIEVSYLEIYQEKVRCLLAPEKGLDLRVRSTPEHGTVVEHLTKITVESPREALLLLSRGNAERVVGSTNMNDKSSRSHAIFSFVLRQARSTENEDGVSVTELHSQVNLVDLAGSERAKSTGAEGDRLKEGANINKSLSVLGLVISGLAEQSIKASKTGKAASGFIPYRDSKLTLLLKENLGGNSKTYMLSALSPAEVNYDETLSTLRYADRAKSIVTKACINEDAKDKIIRQLHAEVERLRKQALAASTNPSAPTTNQPYLVNVETSCSEWAVVNLAEGVTYTLGKRRPGADSNAKFVCVALEDEDDIADQHLTLKLCGVGEVELRATGAPDYLTAIDDQVVETPDPVVVRNKQLIQLGDATQVKFVDPRVTADKTRKERGANRIGSGGLTARGERRQGLGHESPTPPQSLRLVVPPLKLGLTRPAASVQAGEDSSTATTTLAPSRATAGPPPVKPIIPTLKVGCLAQLPSRPSDASDHGGDSTPPSPPPTTQLRAVPSYRSVHIKSEPHDELVAMYHHTFVLLGERSSGKTAFRKVLGKDVGFFDRRVVPVTDPTLGFEIERLDRVGGTAKCSLTLLEISGHRAFVPLCWMIPQSRVTFIIFFRLSGSRDGSRCDLHYFQPFIDAIRTASPSQETGVLLVGTFRDAQTGSDTALLETLVQTQTEITSYWQAVEPVAEKRPQLQGIFAVSCKDRTVLTNSPVPGVPLQPQSMARPATSGSLTARVRTGAVLGDRDPPSTCRKMSDMLSWLVAYGISVCRRDASFVKGLIPVRLTQLMAEIESKRSTGKWALSGIEYRDLAKSINQRYAEKDELLLHTQLLHSWMRLFHHYRHTHLKRLVIIDVAWLFRVLTTFCCAGECVHLGAFSGESSSRNADGVVEWASFVRTYQNASFPFHVGDVRRADTLGLLPRGILTATVAGEIFKAVLLEKRYTSKEVNAILGLLEQFDLTLPSTKVYAVPPQQGTEADDDEHFWATEQDLVTRHIASSSAARIVSPDLVYTIPSYFTKPAPETVTVFVPDLIGAAGPTVCFSMHAVPVHFLSRLAARLARFSNGLFFGAVSAASERSSNWGDCVWIVCGETTRVMLRMVSRSLFVTFHDHEDVVPAGLLQAKAMRLDNGLATARGGDAQDAESPLDDECYEAFLSSTVEKGLDQPLEEREALYIQIRRGMILRRETARQTLIRQTVRDLILESPGASYRERDRVGGDGGKWREIETRFPVTIHSSQLQFNKLRQLLEQQQQQVMDDGTAGAGISSSAVALDVDSDEVSEDSQEELSGPEAEIRRQSKQLHQQLLREAIRTEPTEEKNSGSHAFKLDVDLVLRRLASTTFMGDATYAAVRAALERIADARQRLLEVECSRYRFFTKREEVAASGGAVSDEESSQQLRMLRLLRNDAAASEVAALDALVAVLSGPLTS